MALVDLGYAHFHHLAFETSTSGRCATCSTTSRGTGAGCRGGRRATGSRGTSRRYVRIPEEECHVELYCDMEQLADDHVPRTYPGRPLLVEHLGPAAAALVLPLRPGRDRVRERELGDARQAAAARGGRTAR